MGILQGRRRTRIVSASQVHACVIDSFDDTVIRSESTAFPSVREAPQDPYLAWLEQRNAEREREDEQEVRWVNRVGAEKAIRLR